MKKTKTTKIIKKIKKSPLNSSACEKIKGELRKSEEKLELLLENIPDVVINIDKDGIIEYINHPKAGYVKEEVIGKKFTDCLSKSYHGRFEEAIERVFKDGKADEFEHTDNRFYWWHTRFVPVKRNERVITALVIATDITDSKKAGEEKDKLLKAIEITSEAITLTASDGRIIYANAAMNELFGYKSRELIGEYPSILNAGPNPEAVMKHIIEEIIKNDFWEGEVHNKRKDGSEFVSHARISVLKDKEEKIINYISTQHKIA